jgi:aminoglycoside phosphotransferase (APT) family kinase protein
MDNDPVYRHVMASRDAGALRGSLQQALDGRGAPWIESVRLLQCHYKPMARARLVAAVQGAATPRRWLYLCLYAEPQRAHEEYRAALAAWHGAATHEAPVLLADWNGVGRWLPDAPKLEAIRFCFDRPEFRRFLAAHELSADTPMPELVRYVPCRRALFRCPPTDTGSRGMFIKCYRKPDDLRAASNLARVTRAWHEGRLALRPPLHLFHDAGRHAVGMDAVAGHCFSADMTRAAPELLRRVAGALASLHASAIDAPLRWTPAGELAALKTAMADVTCALPALAAEIDALTADIERRAAGLHFDAVTATLHGNLFGDQIMVDAQHIGIVDWDDLAQGDPLYDVGRLVAHLMHVHATNRVAPSITGEASAELLHAYGQHSGRRIQLPRLRWQVAVALLLRAKISALRTLPDGWAERVAHALAQARAVLEDSGPWLPHST